MFARSRKNTSARCHMPIYAGGNALRSALRRPPGRDGFVAPGRVAEAFRLYVNRRITLSADSDDLAMPQEPYQAVSPDGRAVAGRVGQVQGGGVQAARHHRRTAGSAHRSPLVVAGDADIVTIDHTSTLIGAVPNSELAIVPGGLTLPRDGEV
jgi:hypothetical protein